VNKERYPLPFMEKVLKETYGCLLYQEQFMFLVKEAAGFDLGEADNFRRGIAWLPDNPKYHTVAKYFEKLEQGMVEKGYSKEDVDFFVKYCREFMGYSFNKAHSVVYSYITYGTIYFKCYYPAYFYAALINLENDVEKFQEIISDAEASGIKVLPHSISKSKYDTTVESDTSIRLGIGQIKGMGESVRLSLGNLNLSGDEPLSEVLQKDFGKINSKQFTNLIDIGAFDEYQVDREEVKLLAELYSSEAVPKWFTRKTQRLKEKVMPAILKENFNIEDVMQAAHCAIEQEEPWKHMLGMLVDGREKPFDQKKYLEFTIKKQIELCGFSLFSNSKLNEFSRTLQVRGILPLSDFKDPNKKYYFSVQKVTVANTKTNKKFLQLLLTDGKQTIKAKCWKELDLVESNVYYGKFKKDDYGFTLNDREVYKV
jgi:DNA polymerase III alpha subunit